jgi:tetratricopeptide (TPR) repeat protein
VFLCAAAGSRGQEVNVTAAADSLSAAGEYYYAALAYERAAFLSQTDSMVNICLLKKSRAFKYIKYYTDAIRTLQRINLQLLVGELKYEVWYERILCSYLGGEHEQALKEINTMRNELHDSALMNKTIYLEILALGELQLWRQARERFREYLLIKNIDMNADSVFYFADKPKHRSLRFAKAIGTLIPGAGLIYAGETGKGLLQLSLVGGFAAFGVYNIQQGYYVSGILGGFTPASLFYTGGLRNTTKHINEKNEQFRAYYNGKIKMAILQIEKITL